MTNPAELGGAQRPSINYGSSKEAATPEPIRFPEWSARLRELGLAPGVAAGWERGIVAL